MSPGIIIPTAKGGLVWIHGEDPSGDPVKVQVNASGLAIVTFDGILDAGERLHGFADTVGRYIENTNLAAGTNTIDGQLVFAGEFWHITQIVIVYVGTPPTSIQGSAVVQETEIRLIDQRTITSGVFYPATVDVYLAPVDYMRMRVLGATAGDTLRLFYCGTKQAL